MVCNNCGAPVGNGRSNCAKCGSTDIREGVPVEQITIATNTEQPIKNTSYILPQKSNYWLLIFALAVGAFLLYKLVLIPYAIPYRLWNDTLKEDAVCVVEEYLTERYIEYISVKQDRIKINCEEYTADNAFSQMIVSQLENSDKDLFSYTLNTKWDVRASTTYGETIISVSTTTFVICHPELFDSFEFIRITTVDGDDEIPTNFEDYTVSNYLSDDDLPPLDITKIYTDETESGQVLVVRYKWTNTTNSVTSCNWVVGVDAFQNGIALKEAYTYDLEGDNSTREVQPGSTIEVTEAFYLDSGTAFVELCFGPAINVNDTVWLRKTVTIDDSFSTTGTLLDNYLGTWSAPYYENTIWAELSEKNGEYWIGVDGSTERDVLYASAKLNIDQNANTASGDYCDEWYALSIKVSFEGNKVILSGTLCAMDNGYAITFNELAFSRDLGNSDDG